MTAALAFVIAFCVMELVSYSLHRWVMHGPGMVWHASHHAPPKGRWERNDLFPLCFSVLGFAAFALAAAGVLPAWSWWAAAGITTYGIAYLAVHEIFIHRRLRLPIGDIAYLRWLRDAHRAHHADGGEPYGMLLPLMRGANRQRDRSASAEVDGDPDFLLRSSTRDARNRL